MIIPLPKIVEPKAEPEMQLIGEGKYHYATLKEGDIEVMHRVPLHFFYLDGEKKLDMVREVCKELQKKMFRAKQARR